MFLYSKKTFEFENKDGERFHIKTKEMKSAPEWVVEDNMFKWAVSAGDLIVTETIKEVEKVELEVETVKAEKTKKVEAEKLIKTRKK